MSNISDFLTKTARENVQAALDKAHADESFHALLSLNETRALERAEAVDKGEITGKLAGVPFIAKDNFLTFGGTTTAASKILETFEIRLGAIALRPRIGDRFWGGVIRAKKR